MVTKRRLRMANVLRSILMEELTVWMYWDENKYERFVMSTYVQTDPVSLVKDLVIYSFTGINEVRPLDFIRSLEVIKKYAQGKDCSSILAYTSDPQMKKVLERVMNADVRFSLAQMEV